MVADAVHRLQLTGRHDKSGPRPDLRMTYSKSSGWQIEVLSQHAYNWAQRHVDSFLFDNDGNRIRTNRTGVNILVHDARTNGLKTEYIGPRRVLTFWHPLRNGTVARRI